MISYELCKTLKDAGFPSPIGILHESEIKMAYISNDRFGYFSNGYQWNEEWVYIPTLSELIESCGGKMFRLTHAPYVDVGWIAQNEMIEGQEVIDYPTPEEAVANLWIKINNK